MLMWEALGRTEDGGEPEKQEGHSTSREGAAPEAAPLELQVNFHSGSGWSHLRSMEAQGAALRGANFGGGGSGPGAVAKEGGVLHDSGGQYRGCAFMDTNGFCNYIHIDKFRRVDKEKAKKKEGAEAKVAGKRPSNGSGEGTREKRQRNGRGYGPRDVNGGV